MAKGVVLAVAALVALAAPASASALSWCGSDRVAADRKPDTVAGAQFRVVYAVPADGPDRFAERASLIATDLAFVDEWWRRQDSVRAPRFDLFDAPGCPTVFGRLDLAFVRLPETGAALSATVGRNPRLLLASLRAALGFHMFKKHLVYYDGPVDDPDTCGVAFFAPDQAVAGGDAFVWLGARGNCGTLGTADYVASTAAHEMIHSLGALPPGAPNVCPGDSGHPCDSSLDIMYPGGSSNSLWDYALDVGHDDYYAHPSGWLDIQDSRWLAHLDAARHPLTVTTVSAQEGEQVVSELPGVDCAATCTSSWEAGTAVGLAAVPGDGRRVRWSGDCVGVDFSCAVAMDSPRSVTATFEAAFFTISVSLRGRGRVTNEFGTCPSTCTQSYDRDSVVPFRAQPLRGWRFARWSGACRGTRATCAVRVNAAKSLRAVFVRR